MNVTSFDQIPAALNLLLKKVDALMQISAIQSATVTPPAPSPVLKTYTRKEVAKIFAVSVTTLDGYIHDGIIEASRFGTRIRFTPEAIEDAMKRIQPSKKVN